MRWWWRWGFRGFTSYRAKGCGERRRGNAPLRVLPVDYAVLSGCRLRHPEGLHEDEFSEDDSGLGFGYYFGTGRRGLREYCRGVRSVYASAGWEPGLRGDRHL